MDRCYIGIFLVINTLWIGIGWLSTHAHINHIYRRAICFRHAWFVRNSILVFLCPIEIPKICWLPNRQWGPTLCSNSFWCLYSRLWHDSGRRNYPIRLKFDTNIYMLCEISCTIFGVHCSNRASEEIQKSTSIHYGSWKEIFLKSVLTRLSYIKFNKIYVRYSDAQ